MAAASHRDILARGGAHATASSGNPLALDAWVPTPINQGQPRAQTDRPSTWGLLFLKIAARPLERALPTDDEPTRHGAARPTQHGPARRVAPSTGSEDVS